MATGVEEAVLESPVLGEVHPAVVLVFPTVVPQAADQGRGKNRTQGGQPKPFVGGCFPLLLIAPVMSFRRLLPGADDPQRLRMISAERESELFPETNLIGLARLRFAEDLIRRARLK